MSNRSGGGERGGERRGGHGNKNRCYAALNREGIMVQQWQQRAVASKARAERLVAGSLSLKTPNFRKVHRQKEKGTSGGKSNYEEHSLLSCRSEAFSSALSEGKTESEKTGSDRNGRKN